MYRLKKMLLYPKFQNEKNLERERESNAPLSIPFDIYTSFVILLYPNSLERRQRSTSHFRFTSKYDICLKKDVIQVCKRERER